eukprot:g1335.t1
MAAFKPKGGRLRRTALANDAVRVFLAGYAQTDWDRAVAAALEYGVHSLGRTYALPTIAVDDLEAIVASTRRSVAGPRQLVRTQPSAADHGLSHAGPDGPPLQSRRTKPSASWRQGEKAVEGDWMFIEHDCPPAATAPVRGRRNAPERFPFADAGGAEATGTGEGVDAST